MDKKLKDYVKSGTVILSNDDSESSPAVIVNNDGVAIMARESITGITVDKSSVVIQGGLLITGEGKDIRKGKYTENPKGAKIFTYTETVQMESEGKAALAEGAGKMGLNTDDFTKDGIVPLMTTFDGYPLIHSHRMLFKHTHRIEPAYLYRIPGYVKVLAGFISKFSKFLST